MRTWLGRGVVAAGLAAIVFGAAGSLHPTPGLSGTPGQLTAPVTEPVNSPRVVGVAGCASAACHGGPASVSLNRPNDPRRWACSATLWLTGDPHAKAYAALEGELAGRIMAGLHRTGKAAAEPRCLACHTNPALASELRDGPLVSLRREGVGCEGCHGSAGGWLHEHTTWTAATRAAAYDRTGMMKLYDLGGRAVACAGCHVGAPADPARGYPVRDMNHDMIAAGHPRLNFDFADYQRALPPHWSEHNRATGTPAGPGFEVRAWLVGRVAHAEAACRLLEDRAKRAERGEGPWPEVAEWTCVSCHHSIGQDYPPVERGRKAGSPAWQRIWPVTEPETFMAQGPLAAPSVAVLLKYVQKAHPPLPETRIAAKGLADSLAAVRVQLVETPEPLVPGMAGSMLRDSRTGLKAIDRDTAGQLFHALAAFERMRIKQGDHPIDRWARWGVFARLRDDLKRPRGKIEAEVAAEMRLDLRLLLSTVK